MAPQDVQQMGISCILVLILPTPLTVLGPPGPHGLSAAMTAAEVFGAANAFATTLSQNIEACPVWGHLWSTRSATSFHAQLMEPGPAGHHGLSALPLVEVDTT